MKILLFLISLFFCQFCTIWQNYSPFFFLAASVAAMVSVLILIFSKKIDIGMEVIPVSNTAVLLLTSILLILHIN